MNIEILDEINFHDADIYNYERKDNNISFELKDGWNDKCYYKIKLNNVVVQVMNNSDDLVSYILNVFNTINESDGINLYSGEFGIINEGKCYLKLWIRHPYDMNIMIDNVVNDFKFDGMNIELCNDYDDTGRLFIKFIADNISVEESYPLLKKYSRTSNENMNNLYNYKKYFGENEYKFFSAISLKYLFLDYSYINNVLIFNFRDILDLNDVFSLKFLNISSKLDEIDLDSCMANILDDGGNLFDCIRFVEYKDGKYFIGLLISMDEEIIFTCDSICFEGIGLDTVSILDKK